MKNRIIFIWIYALSTYSGDGVEGAVTILHNTHLMSTSTYVPQCQKKILLVMYA